MSKKNKQKQRDQSQTPKPSELIGKASFEKIEEAPPVREVQEAIPEVAETTPEEPKEAQTLEEMIQGLSPELREKALEEVSKLREQAAKNEAVKAFAQFDNALKNEETGLPKFVGDLAEKHKVDLRNRRITITYPDGKFSYTNSPKGSKGGGNGRSGFPPGWGKAEVVEKDGKTTEYASPSKAAEALGLQVEGMRDMKDVFENPKARGTKAELPKCYKVDAVRGEHFRIKVVS